MNDAPTNDIHSTSVADWENKSNTGLSISQKVKLFERAIQTIEKRASLTLSSVTLLVIIDRVLQQSRENYPILSHVMAESHTLRIKNFEKLTDDELTAMLDGLRFLLIDLLRVSGRLTADILTIPLHNELLKVTWTELETK